MSELGKHMNVLLIALCLGGWMGKEEENRFMLLNMAPWMNGLLMSVSRKKLSRDYNLCGVKKKLSQLSILSFL